MRGPMRTHTRASQDKKKKKSKTLFIGLRNIQRRIQWRLCTPTRALSVSRFPIITFAKE